MFDRPNTVGVAILYYEHVDVHNQSFMMLKYVCFYLLPSDQIHVKLASECDPVLSILMYNIKVKLSPNATEASL